jgi:cobalt/nickel transport system permease protein
MSRPEILKQAELAPGRKGANLIVVGMLVVVLVAILSPLASTNPDGLEKVAEELGFLSLGDSPVYEILPDYTIPFIGNEALTTVLAVFAGTILVFGIAWIIGKRWTQNGTAGD